ncbi:MAG: hypothetical protein AAFV53_18190 [Myxococcota bacterium]
MQRRRQQSLDAAAAPEAVAGDQGMQTAQELYGNSFVLAALNVENRNDGEDGGGPSRHGQPPTDVELMATSNRSPFEAISFMYVQPESSTAPHPCAGAQIHERFSAPRRVSGMFEDSDFRTMTAAEAARDLTCGSSAQAFTVDNHGNFQDFHGGIGFQTPEVAMDILPEAWQRGVAWEFTQTYTHEGRNLAQYNVRRIVHIPDRMVVEKVKL